MGSTIICHYCKGEVKATAKFCPKCGTNIQEKTQAVEQPGSIDRTMIEPHQERNHEPPPKRHITEKPVNTTPAPAPKVEPARGVKGAATPFRPVHRQSLFRLGALDDNGTTFEMFRLRRKTTVIGRNDGDIRIEHDAMMSGKHASLSVKEKSLFIEDMGSSNGVFVRIEDRIELQDGDEFIIGRQRLRFSPSGSTGSTSNSDDDNLDGTMIWSNSATPSSELLELDNRGGTAKAHALNRKRNILGRDQGESTISFPLDPCLDGAHACIEDLGENRCSLTDTHSLNGVWLRLRAPVELKHGARFMLGEQIFEVFAE